MTIEEKTLESVVEAYLPIGENLNDQEDRPNRGAEIAEISQEGWLKKLAPEDLKSLQTELHEFLKKEIKNEETKEKAVRIP